MFQSLKRKKLSHSFLFNTWPRRTTMLHSGAAGWWPSPRAPLSFVTHPGWSAPSWPPGVPHSPCPAVGQACSWSSKPCSKTPSSLGPFFCHGQRWAPGAGRSASPLCANTVFPSSHNSPSPLRRFGTRLRSRYRSEIGTGGTLAFESAPGAAAVLRAGKARRLPTAPRRSVPPAPQEASPAAPPPADTAPAPGRSSRSPSRRGARAAAPKAGSGRERRQVPGGARGGRAVPGRAGPGAAAGARGRGSALVPVPGPSPWSEPLGPPRRRGGSGQHAVVPGVLRSDSARGAALRCGLTPGEFRGCALSAVIA